MSVLPTRARFRARRLSLAAVPLAAIPLAAMLAFSPAALTALMNRLLTPLSNAIIERKGTIDKYMGDAVRPISHCWGSWAWRHGGGLPRGRP